MALQLTRRRFAVSEYHQMAQAGILGEDDRVELIDGEVTQMTPIGRRHAAGVIRMTNLFAKTFGDDALVSAQNPVVLGEYSEPQPDLALLRPRADFYASGLPTPDDILLLVEVAETSADLDRRVKAPLYARSGVQEFWLVDLEGDTVTVYRDPAPSGYGAVRVVGRSEELAPSAFPNRSLAAAAILG